MFENPIAMLGAVQLRMTPFKSEQLNFVLVEMPEKKNILC